MDDERNLARRHRFGAQWKLIGEPDYTERVRMDRPKFHRWLFAILLLWAAVWAVVR